jgi:hypothetical protein
VRRLRGVLTGYLSLVVLGVLVETGPATRLSGLAGDVVAVMRRGLNPAVAGIPDRSAQPPAAPAAGQGGGGGGGGSWPAGTPTAPPQAAPVPTPTPAAPGQNFSTVRG